MQKVFGQDCVSYSRSLGSSNTVTLLNTWGDRATDNYFKSELENIEWMLQINCSLYFYQDIPFNSFYDPKTNNLVLGKNMLSSIINNYGFNQEYPGFAYGTVLPFIVAHEAGHAKAAKMGWNFATGNTNKKNELFADFCAGMYALLQRTLVNSTSNTRYYGAFNIGPILELFESLGDVDFNNPLHHGTSQERKMAVTAGYNFMSNYIFNYQRYYRTNAIPVVTDAELYQAAAKMLYGVRD